MAVMDKSALMKLAAKKFVEGEDDPPDILDEEGDLLADLEHTPGLPRKARPKTLLRKGVEVRKITLYLPPLTMRRLKLLALEREANVSEIVSALVVREVRRRARAAGV